MSEMENAAADKRVTLLYVEDDSEIQDRVVSILQLKFPQITLFMEKNGQDGFDLYRTHHPDIVLTDIRMPVMDGIRMAREIKQVDKSALIIMLTAVSETDAILEAIDIGINHYVMKPVIMEKLIASVERCIEETKLKRQIRHQEESIRRMAYNDSLTGLPNRQLFNKLFHQALAHAQRHNRLLALLYLDLDRFKAVNDTHGHSVGDQLLQAVAQRLKQCCQRDQDTIARFGGDEFIILLSDPDSSLEAVSIARKIIEAFANPFVLDGHELLISPSIGISIYPDDGTHEDELVRNADTAMYSAKKEGRNRFHLFNPSINGHQPESCANLENLL
jgi:diguanylate cyclase (GGDEF)-like protein